jgi:hypothetical protein
MRVHNILVGTNQRKVLKGRPKRLMMWTGSNWLRIGVQWRVIWNTVMKLLVPQKQRNILDRMSNNQDLGGR